MTDRVQYITVVLDNDYRTDDVEPILKAIQQIRGVRSAELGKPVEPSDYYARERVLDEVRQKLWEALK